MPNPYQKTVSLPRDLVEEVERFISTTNVGKRYTSVADFIKDAVRRRLEDLEREERFRRVQRLKGVFSDLDEHE